MEKDDRNTGWDEVVDTTIREVDERSLLLPRLPLSPRPSYAISVEGMREGEYCSE